MDGRAAQTRMERERNIQCVETVVARKHNGLDEISAVVIVEANRAGPISITTLRANILRKLVAYPKRLPFGEMDALRDRRGHDKRLAEVADAQRTVRGVGKHCDDDDTDDGCQKSAGPC